VPEVRTYHPYYEESLKWRLEAHDFYRGGRYVLEPGRTITNLSFVVLNAVISTPPLDPTRPQSRSRFESVPVESYIWTHSNEDSGGYMTRKARAVHVPIFRHFIDLYVSAAMRVPPNRGDVVPGVEPWGTYWLDVDRSGTNINDFVRQAMGYALAWGLEFAITDKPSFEDTAITRQQQMLRGERAYTTLVHPHDLIDWETDEATGGLAWIKIREPDRAPRGITDKWPSESMLRYKIWYPDRWELYAAADGNASERGDFSLVDGGTHPVGEVPLSVFYARRSEDQSVLLQADSMLADIPRLDRYLFNRMSVLDEILTKQGFAQMFVPEDVGSAPGPIDIGPGMAIGFNSENGQPLMVAPEAALIMAHWQSILNTIQLAKESAGVGRGKAEASKEERSADALLVESRNESNRVSALVSAAEEFDRQIHRHVAAWEGESIAPMATYRRDVSMRSLGRQINDALQLKALGLPEETMKKIIAPLVQQHMHEQGQLPADIREAVKSVEEADEALALEVMQPPEEDEKPEVASGSA